MFGLYCVIFAVAISLLAYAIAPDNSPSANEQILAIATHPPLYKVSVLKIRSGKNSDENLSGKLVNGFPKYYLPVPLDGYKYKGDTLFYSEYRGKVFKPEQKKVSFDEILGDEFKNKTTEEKRILVDQCQIEERTYWLGTDKFGRDILSRLIIGTRVSLSVGFISVSISLLIGIFLGALAGYFRGVIDEIIMWFINVFWSIPTILLAMGLYISAGSLIENKLTLIFIAVGFTMWVETARIVRGQFISFREMEFVTAAKSLGFGDARIIFRHILPNILGPLIVIASANFASAILVESGLSFIGLGIQPPAPSWGGMLNEYKDFIDTNKAYLALFPGLAIMVLVLAFNLVGNGLRDALDVRGNLE